MRPNIPDSVRGLYNLVGGETQIGLHAFVTIDDAVLDPTIYQQRQFLDLPNCYITGEFPENLEGSLSTVDSYARRFAEELDMPFELWLRTHELHAHELALEQLRKLREKV
ncbi:hypothetical protein MKX29_08215 [Cytobacillus sp. FSL R7-0696]|uniref:hypothetical protein n=1 Tax=Cytobacillus sp. FSL R7-0696 TaxID=2921691 RepID=UPI0030F8FDA0